MQLKDLAATIAAVPCDSVLLGTPHDLTHLMDIPHSVVSVTYSVADVAREVIAEVGNASKLESATGLAHLLTEFCKAH
jgi:predicted GTPase